MTPDLQEDGSKRREAYLAKQSSSYSAEGSGGQAAFGRVVGDEVDTAHGGILYVDDITVSFDGFRALNKLTLNIAVGELRCIIGPNGAGKTTMMDIITGKTRPDRGDVLFDGAVDLTRCDEAEIAELGIGRKFQKPTVFESQTVDDNLRLALRADHRVRATLFWRETPGENARIARVLYARLQELRESDSDVALRHVWAFRGRLFPDGARDFDEISKRVYRLVSARLPADQAIRMLLKPVSLPHRLERMVQKPLSRLALKVIAS